MNRAETSDTPVRAALCGRPGSQFRAIGFLESLSFQESLSYQVVGRRPERITTSKGVLARAGPVSRPANIGGVDCSTG